MGNVRYLEEFGFKPDQWKRLFVEAPWTLRSDRQRIEDFLCYFHQTLRLPKSGVANLCAKDPRVASLHLQNKVLPCVRYFTRDLEMPKERFLGMVMKYPRTLSLSLEHRIRPIIQFFLDEVKTPKDPFLVHLRSYPGLLGTSLEKSIRFRAQWIQKVTKTDDAVLRYVCLRGLILFETRTPVLFRSYETVLRTLGRNEHLAARILRRVPHVLSWPPSTLERQIRFVQERLGRDLSELYHFPSFLGLSLNDRILPRVELMERIGFKHQRFPLILLFGLSGNEFKDWLREKHGRAELTDRERERILIEDMTIFEDRPLQLADLNKTRDLMSY